MADQITILCLFYGDGFEKLFEIQINRNQYFRSLRTAIRDNNPNFLATMDAKDLQLWKVNIPVGEDNVVPEIESGLKLSPNKKISDYFEAGFSAEAISIMVEKPTPPSASLVLPVSQSSSTRLKRFSDLNQIISQNKRLQTGDKTTIGFSYLRWGEVGPVYKPLLKKVVIPPKDVPEPYVNSLFNHLRYVTRALGGLDSGGNTCTLLEQCYFI